MKYSEAYLRAEEPNFVQFVPDYTSQKRKRASVKVLGPREEDRQIKTEGYLRAEESSVVRLVQDFTCQVHTNASAKGLGPREQDHEILRIILTS
jgi:hypothetical protein